MSRPIAAFTLIELLVVISVIGILAGMLMPAISLVRESSRKATCGSNQRQIVLEMVLYSTEYRAWPDYGSGGTDQGARSQAMMKAKLRDDVKVYVCPSANNLQAMKTDLQTASIATWTVAQTSYAYDFQTPLTAKPGRVVMADRKDGSNLTNHKKSAIAAFADGHIGNMNQNSNVFPNSEAGDTDIYSGTASDTDANVR